VRIGSVDYLNARPLVWGLEHGLGAERIALSHHVPSELSRRLGAGELEVGLLPVVDLARIPELEIVPGLGITTRGPARSVLLVSRCPVESIASLALDSESRTSNVLARVLLAEVWRVRPTVVEAGAAADAVVRIGDKALFDPPSSDTTVIDLGEAWTATTGLPFVFAAWAGRVGTIDRELYGLLHASRRQGTRAIDTIAEAYTWRGKRDPELCRRYLRENILHRLGAAELDGIRRFFGAAARLGLIDEVPPLRLALTRWTACHETASRLGVEL
jgi:chorismate dehydratase